MDEVTIIWTDYFKYRCTLRGFDLAVVESIVRYSTERYLDIVTGRKVVVGRQDQLLVMIPYDREDNTLTPVTIHATNRRQINLRLRWGRFTNE